MHLVGRAAGPLGGDRAYVEVEVGPGARLAVTSAAAAVALAGVDGAWSAMQAHARIAAGGVLCWCPEPLLLTARAAHRSVTQVTGDDGGSMVWWQELVLGRTGEAPGSLVSRLAVDYAGVPLVRHELRVGPEWPGWDSHAALGPYRIHIMVCAAGAAPCWRDGSAPALSDTAAALACEGPGLLVTAAGDDLAAVRGLATTGLTAAGVSAGHCPPGRGP